MVHLDALPPSMASDVGRWIASKRRHLLEHKSWASEAFLAGNQLTVYACDHADNNEDENSFLTKLVALMTMRGSRWQSKDARMSGRHRRTRTWGGPGPGVRGGVRSRRSQTTTVPFRSMWLVLNALDGDAEVAMVTCEHFDPRFDVAELDEAG